MSRVQGFLNHTFFLKNHPQINRTMKRPPTLKFSRIGSLLGLVVAAYALSVAPSNAQQITFTGENLVGTQDFGGPTQTVSGGDGYFKVGSGTGANSPATLNVNASTLNITAGNQFVVGAEQGTGTVNVGSGATLNITNNTYSGAIGGAGGVGTANVNGGTFNWTIASGAQED